MCGAVVYCKGSGEAPTPLTVRLEWLSNGTVKPYMYWTPDGTCCKIIRHSSGLPIALLKDGGEGLRFDITAEVIETPEPYSENLHCKINTCLYLADNRFCQRNIIDERYAHKGKEYIPVVLDVFPDGDYELIYFTVREMRYMVEGTRLIENGGSYNTGGIGVRHKVTARLVNADNDDDPNPNNSVIRSASLYLELNKWFVAVSNTA